MTIQCLEEEAQVCVIRLFVVEVLIIQVIKDRYQRARKLCEILEGCDNDLLPVFCQALIDTGQRQVARFLRFQSSSVACSQTLVDYSKRMFVHTAEPDIMRCRPPTVAGLRGPEGPCPRLDPRQPSV